MGFLRRGSLVEASCRRMGKPEGSHEGQARWVSHRGWVRNGWEGSVSCGRGWVSRVGKLQGVEKPGRSHRGVGELEGKWASRGVWESLVHEPWGVGDGQEMGG